MFIRTSRLPPRAGALAALLPLFLSSAPASAQSRPSADATVLVAKVDAARGKPARPWASLQLEGSFGIAIEGVADGQTVLEGKFREIFAEGRARHTSDLGENGTLEQGVGADLVWEIDPVVGPRVHGDAAATALRRYCALLAGTSPSVLYRELSLAGTRKLGDREHVVLRAVPAEGKADTWYVDAESAMVTRVDISLPTTEGAELVWGLPAEVEAQVVFEDWKRIDGVLFPHRRAVKMGPTTFTFQCSKVEPGAKLDAAVFAPPESVVKLKEKAAKRAAPAGREGYHIVDRDAQKVASIRSKCKPAELSATLATVYPEIMERLNAVGTGITGVPFVRFHATTGEELDIEAGLPIAKPFAEKGRVKNGELPAGRTVVAWHVGPYEKLPDAHRALDAHLDAKGLKKRGGSWEVYWTDPGVVTDPSKWRTQLFAPIED